MAKESWRQQYFSLGARPGVDHRDALDHQRVGVGSLRAKVVFPLGPFEEYLCIIFGATIQ